MAKTKAKPADAVLVKLSVRGWSASKVDKGVTDEIAHTKGAGPGAGRYTKRLIDSASLKDLRAIASEARQHHHNFTRHWDDSGRRLLPAQLVDNYKYVLAGCEANYQRAAGDFIRMYPSLIEAQSRVLGDMFSADDYPSAQEVAEQFKMEVSYEPIPDGEYLPMSVAERDRMVEDIRAQSQKLMAESAAALHHRVVAALKDAHQRVVSYSERVEKAQETGAQVRFKESILDGLEEIAELLPKLNVEGDPFLNGVAERLKSQLKIRDAAKLRGSQEDRDALAGELSALVVDAEAHDHEHGDT